MIVRAPDGRGTLPSCLETSCVHAAIEESVRLFLLPGRQMSERVRISRGFTGDLRNHLDAMFRQSSGFAWIVREQTNFLDAEVAHDRRWQAEVPEIGLDPQRVIGLYRIKAGILQLVCLQLCHQAN